jgi:hypothetical protein
MNDDNWRDQAPGDGWADPKRQMPKSPPLHAVPAEWTQEDDDSLRDAVDPLRAARAIFWAVLLSLTLMGSVALIAKVGIVLFEWVTS